MKRILIGLLLLLLAGCAVPAPEPPAFDPVALKQQVAALPGVSLLSEAPLTFSYPDRALFASGAVLPLPGGPAVLDPLCRFLQRNPRLSWRVDMRVQTDHGSEYDQNLVEKRSELLASYLLSKGVSLAGLDFRPEAADGPPVQFTLNLPPQAANQ